MYSFGETDIFNQASNPEGSFVKKLQKFLTHYVFGFSPPLIIGRGVFNYSFGIIPMPYRRPINTVGECMILVWFQWFEVYVPVNNYGHVESVSSPNHTFFLGKLD